jgi:Fibronectin type III domain
MKITNLFMIAIGLIAATTTSPGIAVPRGIRSDAPGNTCGGAPDWGQILSNGQPVSDPYASLDGNSDGTQNPSTFFNPGTVVTQTAIFCAPVIAYSVGAFPQMGDWPNWASQPVQNPDQSDCGNNTPNTCGYGPTLAVLTAQVGAALTTEAVMYVWYVSPPQPGCGPNSPQTPCPDPAAEVIVWTLPSASQLPNGGSLPNGGFEIEFDGWCGSQFAAAVANAAPWFIWNGVAYTYNSACGANGANFNDYDLVFDSTGLVGYVDLNNLTWIKTVGTDWTASVIPVPTGVTVQSANGIVNLTWTPSASWTTPSGTVFAAPTSYNLYSSASPGTEGSTPCQTGIAANSVSPTAACVGPYFTVAAVYGGAVSGQSQVPATPTNLGASSASASVTLTWTGSASATSYDVFEGTTSGGESTTPIKTGVGGTSYTVPGLTPGQTYFFEVDGVNAGGNSQYSNQASATVLASVPTLTSATAGNGAVTLSWSASEGATSYSVYQGTSAGGEGNTAVASSSATTTTLSALTNGQTYYFKVAAIDAGGPSAKSNEVSATPTAPPAPSSSGGGAFGLVELLLGIAFTCAKSRSRLLRARCMLSVA